MRLNGSQVGLKLLKTAIVVAVICGSVCVVAAPADASTGPWSNPITLAEGWAWFPTIASDVTGRVHIVWNGVFADEADAQPEPSADARDDFGALYYVRRNQDRWTTPVDIALIQRGRMLALRSSLASDVGGVLHLVYKGYGSLSSTANGTGGGFGPEDLWHMAAPGPQAETVRAWSPAKRITRGTNGYFSDLTSDATGKLHAIWTESERGTWGIYYANSLDGNTWSSRVAIDGDSYIWWYRAHVQVDGRGWVHAVWERVERRYATDALSYTKITGHVYALSKDGGATWTKLFQAGLQQPAVGIDGNGTILLVSRDATADRIVFQRSSDGAVWTAPAPLPGIRIGVPRPYDVYDMATDSAGHVHLAVVGYPTNSPAMALMHLEWDGQQWSGPGVIAAAPPYPEYPKLAVSDGNHLHVVWFDGDQESIDRDPIRVRYSDALTTAPRIEPSAPAQQAAPVPNRAPSPVPTAVAAPPGDDRLQEGGAAPPHSVWAARLRSNSLYSLFLGLLPVVALLAGSWLARQAPVGLVFRLLPWSKYGRR